MRPEALILMERYGLSYRDAVSRLPVRTCKADGCSAPERVRGLCGPCYDLYRHGDILDDVADEPVISGRPRSTPSP